MSVLNITDNRSCKLLTYGNISIGSLFEREGQFFIKTDLVVPANNERNCNPKRYAIELGTGQSFTIDNDKEVNLINVAELVVKY